MALFNLTDINFNAPKGPTGPLSPLVGGAYEYNMLKYPIDIGNTDKAHYLVININEQAKTSNPGEASSDKPSVIQNRISNGLPTLGTNLADTFGLVNDLGNGWLSTAKAGLDNKLSSFAPTSSALNFLKGTAQGGIDTLTAGITQASTVNFTRTIRRITDTIVLYMPDTLTFDQNQSYDTPSLGGTLPAAALAAGASIGDMMKNKSADPNQIGQAFGKNLSVFLASIGANTLGDLGKVFFSAGFGVVQNPMLEMLYSSPQFRQFRFDFMLYPRSEDEALQVQNIIEKLRYHQAPELLTSSGGFFLVPPSEFDISFYYNGQINPNIPRISTCVLESINIDYAPNGFSAYEVPNEKATKGRTGMPVAIRLSLQFKETEMVYKNSNLLDTKMPTKFKMLDGITGDDDGNALPPTSSSSQRGYTKAEGSDWWA